MLLSCSIICISSFIYKPTVTTYPCYNYIPCLPYGFPRVSCSLPQLFVPQPSPARLLWAALSITVTSSCLSKLFTVIARLEDKWMEEEMGNSQEAASEQGRPPLWTESQIGERQRVIAGLF